MEENKRYVFRLFNLPDDTKEEDVKELAETVAPVKRVWAATKNGVCCGFAFIEVEDEDTMRLMMQKFNRYLWRSALLFTML